LKNGLVIFPIFVLFLAVFGLGLPQAHAIQFQCSANLDGSQEVPPSGSLGTGSAAITYDDNTNQLSWNIAFVGLSNVPFAAHFHEAPFGINGPVVVPISLSASPFIGNAIVPPAAEASLLAGNVYINIHTVLNPAGEIRGQVTCSQTIVGGELLPLDTTSLLLAGAQTFSWMIPVILSGIGIGLFVVSRKSE